MCAQLLPRLNVAAVVAASWCNGEGACERGAKVLLVLVHLRRAKRQLHTSCVYQSTCKAHRRNMTLYR
jgi:hypothetical protein